jgi:hypothetical protein
VLKRCPKAIPVAKTTTMKVFRRLPHAALCRSCRRVGLFVFVVTIEISPFLQETGGDNPATYVPGVARKAPIVLAYMLENRVVAKSRLRADGSLCLADAGVGQFVAVRKENVLDDLCVLS